MTNHLTNYHIHSIEYGSYQNFNHILEDPKRKKAIVFDPAWDAEFIQQRIVQLGLTLEAICITHGHHDHVGAIEELRALQENSIPVYVSQAELDFVASRHPELPRGFLPLPKDAIPLKDGETLSFGEITLTVIATPGHTPGSICYLLENDLITGDTLFIDGCGRADLDGSNPEILFNSLKRIIDEIPHHVRLRTGHNYGPVELASLKEQLTTNPYLIYVQQNKEAFINYRMR